MLEAKNIRLHIPERAEHKDAPILDRIAADQDPGRSVQQGNASRRMSRKMNDFQFSPTEVDHISLSDRDNLTAPVAAPIVRFLIGMHVKGLKLCIAAHMITVSMGIEQHYGEVRQCGGNVPRSMNIPPGIYQQGSILTGEDKKPHTAVLNTPGIMVNLNDLIFHGKCPFPVPNSSSFISSSILFYFIILHHLCKYTYCVIRLCKGSA